MFQAFLALVASVWMMAAGAPLGSVAPTIMRNTDTRACEAWVDSVYDSMTERQRVAQLIFPKAVPGQGESSRASIRRLVADGEVGGLLFTSGSLEDYVEMTNYAQSIAKVPLLMTFDGEWGLSMRIADTPKFPDNMALGAIRDENLLYDFGREMARECRLAGIQVNFAPVLDVNSNPSNPVIGRRSFGEDPQQVARLGAAYSRGLEDGGVQAVGKHFPGHGDTSTDSHKEVTLVNHDRAVLDSIDLVPFKRYIGAGLSGIMVGHLVVPALDADRTPASLSHKITTGLLRDQMGFGGLIYTDALGMKGAHVPGKNNAVLALEAGADVLLSSNHPMDDLKALMQAVESGRISRDVVKDRCKRVLRYKYALGLSRRPAPIDIKGLSREINSAGARAVVAALARASITVLRNEGAILPVGHLADARIAVINIGAKADNDFTETCRRYARIDAFAAADGVISDATLAKLRGYDVVIAAVYDDKASSRIAFGRVADLKGLVSVFMVDPYKMNKFHASLKGADAIVLAYENIPEMRCAAAMAVFGGIDVDGRLPVNLPRVAPLGTGVVIPKSRLGYTSPVAEGMRASLTDSIDSIVGKALRDGAFPGCQVLVARNGNVVYDKSFGRQTASGAPVTAETLYDLASVSKATGTLPGVMKAFDLGLFALDDAVSTHVPGLRGTGKDSIRVSQLLYHESGIPAALNMYDVMMDTTTYSGKLITGRRDREHTIAIQRGAWGNNTAKVRTDIVRPSRTDGFDVEAARGMWVGTAAFDTIMGRIYNIPLRKNNNYTYSCLNFCLLMDMEQRLTGQSHDRFVTDSVWAPLGAYNLCYRPTLTHPLSQIAPTEHDSFMRRQTVHGFVHDETAAMIGGVSGNAGVFGTATDLAKLCQMWLNGGEYGDARVLSEQTVDLFTKSKSPTCRRGLGFDKPDMENPEWSPTCDEAGPAVYGHLGFTGTVFWVDPSENLIFIFLTNRVNPTRDNAAFSKANIRPELFRQVYKSIQK